MGARERCARGESGESARAGEIRAPNFPPAGLRTREGKKRAQARRHLEDRGRADSERGKEKRKEKGLPHLESSPAARGLSPDAPAPWSGGSHPFYCNQSSPPTSRSRCSSTRSPSALSSAPPPCPPGLLTVHIPLPLHSPALLLCSALLPAWTYSALLCSAVLLALGGKQHWLLCSTASIMIDSCDCILLHFA